MEHENKIQEFCSITGVNEEIAKGALEISNWDLVVAVQVFMDESSDDLLRQPMPQKYDKLVDDNPHQRAFLRRPQNNIAINPFNGVRGATTSFSRKRTLDTLFNPPTDITCKMSFEMAKIQASTANRFLLVDIQKASEFECCVLNRDVWSDIHIRELIGLHFVLWQVRSDSEDGLKFIQYYKVNLWPYIAILDPRTGENLLSINSCKLDNVTQSIEAFLEIHNSFLTTLPQPPTKRRKKNEVSIIDLSEEDQLSSAIKESLKNGSCNGTSYNLLDQPIHSLDDFVNANEDYEICEATNKSLTSLSNQKESFADNISSIMEKQSLTESPSTSTLFENSICKVVIRLKDGTRHSLNKPSDTKLKVLFAFVNGIVGKGHQLLLMWPKRSIPLHDSEKTFFDAGLFPNNIVYVEEVDDS